MFSNKRVAGTATADLQGYKVRGSVKWASSKSTA